LDFLIAIDRYKRQHSPHPEWWEVLAVLKSLGYQKVAKPDYKYLPTEIP